MTWRGVRPRFWLDAQKILFDKVNCALEVCETCGPGTIVGGDDEVVNIVFVVGEKGMDVGLVDQLRALGLGEDEVAEKEETDG